MPLIDLHTHICFCPAQEMLQACKQRGIQTLGISEHVYQMREIRNAYPDFLLEGQVYSIADYATEFEKNAGHGVTLLMGLELDILPGRTEAMWETLSHLPLDYVIGSVHELDGWDIHWEHNFSPRQSKEKWHEYLTRQMEWIREGNGNILGHPVRMAVSVTQIPPDIETLMDRLAQCARQQGVAIEINARDYAIAPELVTCLLRQCARHQCYVSVGSDAHAPQDIGRAFDRLQSLLQEIGVRHTTIWRNRRPIVCPIEQ